jgi:TIR domain
MKVFISHSQRDSGVALELADRLASTGHEVWRDHPAALGESVSGAIATAIECADAFIILVSPHLLDSEFSLLEIGGALAESESSGKPVIPVLLDRNVELPALLRDRVYVDLSDRQQRQEGLKDIEEGLKRGSEIGPKRSREEDRVEIFAAAERYLGDEMDHYLSRRRKQEVLLLHWSRIAIVLTSLTVLLVTLVTWVALSGNGLLVSLIPLVGGVVIGALATMLSWTSGIAWSSRRLDVVFKRKGSADDGNR